MDRYFIETAIRTYENDPQAKVYNFHVESARKSESNFGSAVYRANIDYKLKISRRLRKISVIIKTQSSDIGAHGDDAEIYNMETSMYGILSDIQLLMKVIGDSDVLCPT